MPEGEYIQIIVDEPSLPSIIDALPILGFELVSLEPLKKHSKATPAIDPLDDETFGMLSFNTKEKKKMFAKDRLNLRREKNDPNYEALKTIGDKYLESLKGYVDTKTVLQKRKGNGIIFSSLGFAFDAVGIFFLIGASIVDVILSSIEGVNEMPYLIAPIILYSFAGVFAALGIAFLIVGLPKWLNQKKTESLQNSLSSYQISMAKAINEAKAISK